MGLCIKIVALGFVGLLFGIGSHVLRDLEVFKHVDTGTMRGFDCRLVGEGVIGK
jgi:hypothetical protein